MFHMIANYIRGYVTVEVSGFSIERFINIAVNKGIQIWDIQYNGTAVQMNVGIKGFKRLKECSKKTMCHVKIVDKTGVPFQLFKHRKRKALLYGVLLFIAALYSLASFIWIVEIEGNERIKKSDIIDFCNEQGLKPGVWKHSINTKDMTIEFRRHFSEMSFIAIELSGTKAVIKIKETIAEPEIVDKSTPCNVVAKKTGLIVSIATSAGTPLVKQKDVVQEGDILVSGELTLMDGEEVKKKNYVHASAEIYGKLYYQAEISEPIEYREKFPTGEKKTGISIKLLDWYWDIYSPKIRYINYDTSTTERQLSLGGDFALPIVLITDEYTEYNPIIKQHTDEALEELLENRLSEKLSAEMDIGAQILDIKTNFAKGNGKYTLSAIITTLERIDAQSVLEIPIPALIEEKEDSINEATQDQAEQQQESQ